MTNQDAINILIQRFLQDQETPTQSITDALQQISTDKPFETLGCAMYSEMMRIHVAKLEAAKATITAQQPKRKLH